MRNFFYVLMMIVTLFIFGCGDAKETANNAADSTSEMASDAMESTKEAASDAVDATEEGADVADCANEKASPGDTCSSSSDCGADENCVDGNCCVKVGYSCSFSSDCCSGFCKSSSGKCAN